MVTGLCAPSTFDPMKTAWIEEVIVEYLYFKIIIEYIYKIINSMLILISLLIKIKSFFFWHTPKTICFDKESFNTFILKFDLKCDEFFKKTAVDLKKCKISFFLKCFFKFILENLIIFSFLDYLKCMLDR